MKRVGAKSGQMVRSASRRGKTPSRFQFDVTIDRVYGVKAGGHYMVKWSRGVKVASTRQFEAGKEHTGKHGLPFGQKISLLVTLYRDDAKKIFEEKDTKLALISVNPTKKQERTVAKLHFNLSEFAGVPSASATKVFKLSDKVSCRATVDSRFVKSGKGGPGSTGASSALSGMTGVSGRSSDDEPDDDLADLALDDIPEPEVRPRPSPHSRPPAVAQPPSSSSSRVKLIVESPGSSMDQMRHAPSSNSAKHSGGMSPSANTPKGSTDIVQLQAQYDKLNVELRRSQDKRKRMEAAHQQELAELRGRLENSSASSAALEESDALLRRMTEKAKSLEIENNEMREKCDELSFECDQYKSKAQEADMWEAKSRQLSMQLDHATASAISQGSDDDKAAQEVQARLDANRKEKEDLETRLQAHKDHMTKVRGTYEKLSSMYEKLRSENVEMQTEIDALRASNAELKQKVSQGGAAHMSAVRSSEDTNALQDKIEKLEAKLKDTEQIVQNAKASKESLESDHSRVLNQLETLQEKLDKTLAEMRQARKNEDDLRAEVDELTLQRDSALKRALSKGRGSMTSDAGDSSTLREELRIAKERSERELTRCSERIEELEEEVRALSEDVNYERTEKNKAREERDALRESARALERKISEAAQKQDSLHHLRREISTHKMREEDLQAIVKDLRLQVKRLEHELDQAQSAAIKVRGVGKGGKGEDDASEMLGVLVQTKLSLAQAEEDKLQLMFEMKKVKKAERAIQERLAGHASSLEVKLGKAREELESLRRKQRRETIENGHMNGADVDY